MEFIKIEATERQASGKGVARRLRRAGQVPAIVYGKKVESAKIALDPKALKKALSGELRINTPLDVVVTDNGGKTKDYLCMVKDHQYDPVSRELLHVDFLAIDKDQEVEIDVPVTTTGRAKGVQLGGFLRILHHTVSIICSPENFPANIEIDITDVDLNQTLHTNDIKMPENVRLNLDASEAIISIVAPSSDDSEDEAEAEDA